MSPNNGSLLSRQEKLSLRLDLRLTSSLMERLEIASERKELSVNGYIRMVLRERMDQDAIFVEEKTDQNKPGK